MSGIPSATTAPASDDQRDIGFLNMTSSVSPVDRLR
jgi:hypothetical protein